MISITKDPAMQALGTDKRTVILDELRKEFCPKVDDNDWASIAREIDKNQPELAKSLVKLVKLEDYGTIYEKIIQRFNKRK
jgi:hypothetical protein